MVRRFAAAFLAGYLLALAVGCTRDLTLVEASGIHRDGDTLLIVSDERPGVIYRYSLAGVTPSEGVVPIDRARLTHTILPEPKRAADLESIGKLADGRVVLLSEGAHAIFDESGAVVARYPADQCVVDNRGLEGIAVRATPGGDSIVAVLCEGGYPKKELAPDKANAPFIMVTTLAKGARGLTLAVSDLTLVHPAIPVPPGTQRFRAPDFVWHKGRYDADWGFIVILSSTGPGGEAPYERTLLQRYDMAGRSLGEALDLRALLPADLREKNWEGLGWYIPGDSLLLIYDSAAADDNLRAVVLPLPEEFR